MKFWDHVRLFLASQGPWGISIALVEAAAAASIVGALGAQKKLIDSGQKDA